MTLSGELDQSLLGHQGAGKMLSDVWVFEIGSSTSLCDDLLEEEDGRSKKLVARGWLTADVVKELARGKHRIA